ncbi:unnamed protein product [Linum trigynum]|uniref:AMP-activated protein kinase glycogen-binding domain-containing protein n=1 Tax=Linum trigynum TaxID=586398 RepID=A0AAV2D924_9ROSI
MEESPLELRSKATPFVMTLDWRPQPALRATSKGRTESTTCMAMPGLASHRMWVRLWSVEEMRTRSGGGCHPLANLVRSTQEHTVVVRGSWDNWANLKLGLKLGRSGPGVEVYGWRLFACLGGGY